MITCRPYQETALDNIWHYFASGNKGNPLIAWPCGTGKSVLPAVFIERIMKVWPTQRFMMITHVAELIKQNYEVLKQVWPNAPVGIYSAGLKSKDTAFPIIYAGIQSAIKSPMIFGHRDICFIDEAHLVNDNESSQYLTFLSILKSINPHIKIIGMSATPYRMGMGLLTEGGIFTDIIHDLTDVEGFNQLLADGFMLPLIPLRTKTELDVSSVGVQKNEFIAKQLQSAVDKQEITYNALRETCEAGYNRKSWLIFSSGIEHSEHIADMLGTFGIECAAVHSKKSDEFNNNAIKAFKEGRLRAISNFSKLTTGFNHPEIDLIVDLRPTLSVPLHVQKYGRGTRNANEKNNCLVLDFARNIPRLGCINDPIIPRKKGEKTGDIPIKICDTCGAYNHISARICCQCGAEFDFKVKIVSTPGNMEILRSDLPVIESYEVDRVIYAPHDKLGSPQSLKITYFTGMQSFREFICIEHSGLAGHKAREWWRQVHKSDPPTKVVDALKFMSELRVPKRLRIWVNKKWPEIVGREF